MDSLSVDHLTGIKHLTKKDIELIFKTADSFKEVINRSIKKVPSLRDITIANLFFLIDGLVVERRQVCVRACCNTAFTV